MQYCQSWKNWVCRLRRQNLQFIERAYALLLWLPVHAAHLSCVLWQQELHHHCLNSGLYSVCSGQSPHASRAMLSFSPRLISTPSAIRWRPFVLAGKVPSAFIHQTMSPPMHWRSPLQGRSSLGGTCWLWARLLRWVTQETHHRGKQMMLCCLPSKLPNNLLAHSHN